MHISIKGKNVRAKTSTVLFCYCKLQSQGEFIYADEEISPRKSRLEIKSIDLAEDAEFILKPIEETEGNIYECTNFPKGEPMLIDVEKGAWYKIGIAMENPTDEVVVVVFHVVNAEIRVKVIPL